MRALIQGRRLHCAYLRARGALHRIAASAASERGALASTRAIVTIAPVTESMNLDEVWTISYVPQPGSLTSRFNARLWVQYRKDGGAMLKIIAECAPLRGDAASRRCNGLLRELAARIERHAGAM